MTNEELAMAIKGGDKSLLMPLWVAVKGFCAKCAYRWLDSFNAAGASHGLEIDDLMNSGFIAMCSAVDYYTPERGNFICAFSFFLKSEFAKAFGVSRKVEQKDPLKFAVSLSEPYGIDDSGEFGETIVDPHNAIDDLEGEIYRSELRDAVRKILDGLPDDERAIMEASYFRGLTSKGIAKELGYTERQVRTKQYSAFRHVRKNEEAMATLHELYYFNPYGGVSLQTFKDTGASVQERFLLWCERNKKRNTIWKEV